MRKTLIAIALALSTACAPLPTGEDIVETATYEMHDAQLNGVDKWRYIPRGNERKHKKWCVEFVQWVLSQHLPAFDPPLSGERIVAGVFLTYNAITHNIDEAMPGDVIYLDRRNNDGKADHVAIFTGIDKEGLINTIDGNVGRHGVERRKYREETVLWIGRLTDEVIASPKLYY